MREMVAEAEADHDVMLRVTVLLMLPHALAYQVTRLGREPPPTPPSSRPTELGDLYIGMCYIASMHRAPGRRRRRAASDAAETAWSHLSGYRKSCRR